MFHRLSILVFAVLLAGSAAAQSIFTIAGGGTTDGQLATSIPTPGPRGIAIDRAGNVYVVVADTNQVVRIDSAGRAKTIAGLGAAGFTGDGGLAVNATFRQPFGIAIDSADNLYIADEGNDRVRRIDAGTGIITTFAGGGQPETGIGDGGQATAAMLRRPRDIAIAGGRMFITEAGFDAHRVRRIDLATGVITTIAGKTDGSRGGFSGDGGAALEATLDTPSGIAVDSSGNIFIADLGNNRVRRIDTNGFINTYAGGGTLEDSAADGNAATSARFTGEVIVVALDADGNLLIGANPAIRRVDRATGIISTVGPEIGLIFGIEVDGSGAIVYSGNTFNSVYRLRRGETEAVVIAGGGTFVGDGLPATAAILLSPQGLAVDGAGNILIADSGNNVVRRIAKDGTITTFAGVVGRAFAEAQEGAKANEAAVGFPRDLAIDTAGNVYIADLLNERIWRVAPDGTIRTYAGGAFPADGVGDGGAATAARIYPRGIGLDRSNNLFIADANEFTEIPHMRVRRVDAQTGVITTVAGGANKGFSGDRGPATQALLSDPTDIAVDADGNVFISDSSNRRIRQIDLQGTITTFAGSDLGESEPLGDNGPATLARMEPHAIEINRTTGDMYVIDSSSHRVRKIDGGNAIITTVAGSGFFYLDGDFAGDNGPATSAKLNFDFGDLSGIAFTSGTDLIFSDSENNRIRSVPSCGDVAAPVLLTPANGASTSTAPELTWSKATRAFRYDVLVDTVNPPARIVANDVSGTSFATSNLLSSTNYFWRVVAKGDPFCPPVSTSSAIGTFTTSGVCTAAAFDPIAPAAGAAITAPAVLTWNASPGAASYDVYLGTSSPPPLFAQNVTGTSFTATGIPDGRYFWFIVAHAACDPTETIATVTRSFDLTGGVACTPGQLAVTTTAPPNGSANNDTTITLMWSVAGVASSYDVFFGTQQDPPLINAGVTAQRQQVSGLSFATTYFWRIVARGPCDPNGVTSPVASFTTQTCTRPGEVVIAFAPASVSAGTTYTIVWTPASGLDAAGGYLVERSTSSSFTSDVQSQVVSTTAASFDAEITGAYFHRVRAVPACDPTSAGPPSSTATVNVTTARANVIMTVQPAAEIMALGDRFNERRGSFALENLGTTPLQIIVGRQELGGSVPFFTIFDARGGDSAFVTLEPRVPRMFEIRYSGPPNDVPASYQGVIFVASTGEGLPVTPYAFVNLKVGGAASAAPEILVDGTPVEYAAFPPFAGDDRNRPPLAITVRNPGTVPMDLAAEIGPEVWLTPETGWNSTPLAPGASRTVNLFTARGRAPNGSPLPRYTYFTIRTKDGASRRLLVQDNDDVSVSSGRTIRLGPGERSIIVPEVVSGVERASTIRLSNVGNDRVQAEVIFTPSGADGFDGSVRRAVVIVPPNDVVTLTDPIVQLFRLPRPQSGQIEIRVARERQGLIGVTSSIGTPGRGASSGVPTVNRADGARSGIDHEIPGITRDATTTTTLTLAETTGTDTATVRLTLVSGDGATLGSMSIDLPRYGHRRFDDIVTALGGNTVDGGRLQIATQRGAGVVTSVAFIGDASLVSVPVNPVATAGALALRLEQQGTPVNVTLASVVPVISMTSGTKTTRTRVGLSAPFGTSATFTVTLRNAAGGAPVTRQIPVPSNATLVIRNVFEAFGMSEGSSGSLLVESPTGSKVHAVLETTAAPGAPAKSTSSIPVPTTFSEALTSAAAFGQRPLFYDGIEQSTDPARGSRWTLLLSEVAGSSGNVTVRLYEAANRSVPIAQRDFNVLPYQQLTLDTVFAQMGLDATDRRKDRTNVLLAVTARGGNARVAATAIATDNVTGEVKAFALMPSAGSGTPNVSLVTPVVTAPAGGGKRRAVRP